MTQVYSLATSFLLSRGWEEKVVAEGAASWTRRGAFTVVPMDLEVGTLGWQQFLLGIAAAEKSTPSAIADAVMGLSREPKAPGADVAGRTQLDLHLDGPGVRDHETDAWRFGQFVTAAADAVNELIKDSVHIERHSKRLQIVGGATEGSVRLLLREPVLDVDNQAALIAPIGESPEARALRTMAQIFNSANQAAQSPVDSILDAHVRLDPGARKALLRLAKIMGSAAWDAQGHLLMPGQDPVPVELSLAGAHRLRIATQDSEEKIVEQTYHGKLDAWAWSDGEMKLLKDDGHTIRAAVPAALQLSVARLIGDPDQRVTATFQVLERRGPKGTVFAAQHALISIDVDPRVIAE